MIGAPSMILIITVIFAACGARLWIARGSSRLMPVSCTTVSHSSNATLCGYPCNCTEDLETLEMACANCSYDCFYGEIAVEYPVETVPPEEEVLVGRLTAVERVGSTEEVESLLNDAFPTGKEFPCVYEASRPTELQFCHREAARLQTLETIAWVALGCSMFGMVGTLFWGCLIAESHWAKQ